MDATRTASHTTTADAPRHRIPLSDDGTTGGVPTTDVAPIAHEVAAPASKVQAYLRANGQDWDVVAKPVYQPKAGPDGVDIFQPVDGYRGIYRNDPDASGAERTGAQPLAIVTTQYQPVSNREAFAVLEPLVENHQMKLNRVGSHHGDRNVFIAGEIASAPLAHSGGKDVSASLFVETSHDGFGGMHPSLDFHLPDAKGGLRIPFQSGWSTHRGDVHSRLKQSHDLYQKAAVVLQTTMDRFGTMANEQVSRNEMRSVIAKTFDAPEDPLEWTAQTMRRQISVSERVLEHAGQPRSLAQLTSDGDAGGNDPTAGPTKLQVLRGVIDYTATDMRSRGGEQGRQLSGLVGIGHEAKLKAFNLLVHGAA